MRIPPPVLTLLFHLSLLLSPSSMGCGTSKGGHDDDQSLAGLPRPVVCSRVDKIKRRSTSMLRRGTNVSKKEQLNNIGDIADIDYVPVNGTSKEDGQRTGPTRLMLETELDGEGEAVMKAPENGSGTATLSTIKEDGSGGEEEMRERGGDEYEEEEEEENEGDVEEVGLVSPRSPSFREYCTTTDNDGENDNLHSDQTDAENSQLSNSNQGSSVNKDKKGRGFRRAIMNIMVNKLSSSRPSQAGASTSH